MAKIKLEKKNQQMMNSLEIINGFSHLIFSDLKLLKKNIVLIQYFYLKVTD